MSDIQIITHSNLTCEGVDKIICDNIFSKACLAEAIAKSSADHIGIVTRYGNLNIASQSLDYMQDCLEAENASMVYSDYIIVREQGQEIRNVNEAERHVTRDTFDFGPLIMARRKDLLQVLNEMPDCDFSAIYGITLGLQRLGSLYRTAVLVGSVNETDNRASDKKQFDYVRPDFAKQQVELEKMCTDHLKRINALMDTSVRSDASDDSGFNAEASVIIPVRNRHSTIADAVRSALNQSTNFAFNVIVVDNHSTDGTTQILQNIAVEDPRLVHIIPTETDLGIGGCWNVAVNDSRCGRIAVQLDSDDLYSSNETLATMVNKFAEAPYAMVIGSYKLVDFSLNTIPPGVIDHKEWTDKNGPNNILRINGLGAPRAFRTTWIRSNPLPNVSYGEDYAAGLCATRHYRVGRIMTPVYLCRRWGGNSDAGINASVEAAHNAYKDRLRSDEIDIRIAWNKKNAQ